MAKKTKIPTKKKGFSFKLLGYEDIIVGIVLGILMVGYTKKLFTLPYNDTLLIIGLFLFILLAILDIFYELKTIVEDFAFSILAVLWNAIEIGISTVFLLYLYAIKIGYLSDFIQLLENDSIVIGLGIFFILGNIFWLVAYHKIN